MTMTQIAIPVKHLTSKLLKKAALPADRIFGENLDARTPRCYGTLEPNSRPGRAEMYEQDE